VLVIERLEVRIASTPVTLQARVYSAHRSALSIDLLSPGLVLCMLELDWTLHENHLSALNQGLAGSVPLGIFVHGPLLETRTNLIGSQPAWAVVVSLVTGDLSPVELHYPAVLEAVVMVAVYQPGAVCIDELEAIVGRRQGNFGRVIPHSLSVCGLAGTRSHVSPG
jgi:hypothetical protein